MFSKKKLEQCFPFSNLSVKICVAGAQKNHIIEMVHLSTHNTSVLEISNCPLAQHRLNLLGAS